MEQDPTGPGASGQQGAVATDPGAEWDAAHGQQGKQAATATADPGAEWDAAHGVSADPGSEWDKVHAQMLDTGEDGPAPLTAAPALPVVPGEPTTPPAPQTPLQKTGLALTPGQGPPQTAPQRLDYAAAQAPADQTAGALRGPGRTVHGMIASTLLGSATQPLEDIGTSTVNWSTSTPKERALALTRLGLNAAGPVLGKVGAAGLGAAGMASELAEPVAAAGVGAATGAANMPDHPVAGALLGTILGAAHGHAERPTLAPEPPESVPSGRGARPTSAPGGVRPENAGERGPAVPDGSPVAGPHATGRGPRPAPASTAVALEGNRAANPEASKALVPTTPDPGEEWDAAHAHEDWYVESDEAKQLPAGAAQSGARTSDGPTGAVGSSPAPAPEPPAAENHPRGDQVASPPPEDDESKVLADHAAQQLDPEHTFSPEVRDAKGRPKKSLTGVRTDAVVKELSQNMDAREMAPDNEPAKVAAQRTKWIDRLWGELSNRGHDTAKIGDMIAEHLGGDESDATSFDPNELAEHPAFNPTPGNQSLNDAEADFHDDARTPSGSTRDNLTKVKTDALLREWSAMKDAQSADPSTGVRVSSTWSDAGDVHTGRFRDDKRPRNRADYISRIEEELSDRGLSTRDMAKRTMALADADDAAKAAKDAAEQAEWEALPPEERFAGPGLPAKSRAVVQSYIRHAVVGPFEDIREKRPSLTSAAERTLASPGYARYFAGPMAKTALKGETQADLAGVMRQKTIDQLEAIDKVAPDPQRQAEIARLYGTLPANFDQSPTFTRINGKLQPLIDELEQAAPKAGVRSQRNAANGYMHLESSVQPATRASVGAGAGPRTATAAKQASGLGTSYTEDPFEMLGADAADKFPKAARNDFYREVVKHGQPARLAAQVPPDKAAVFIDDGGNVLRSAAGAKFKVIVDPTVRDAVDHVEATMTAKPDKSIYGRANQSVANVAGSAAIMANPKVLLGHGGFVANVVGSETGGPLGALASLTAPAGGRTALGLGRILAWDRQTPDHLDLERELVRAGGTRPIDPGATEGLAGAMQRIETAIKKKLGPLGPLFSVHDLLFGENGLDIRGRTVLASDIRDAYKARTGADMPWSETAQYVNMRAGNYVKGNAGKLIDALQAARFSQFARMTSARIGTSVGQLTQGAVTGRGFLPGTPNQRALDIAIGLAKKIALPAAGLEGLNYLLSHHSTLGNAPGHAGDVQLGEDNPSGPNKYLNTRFTDPLAGTLAKTGVGALAQGDTKGAATDALNTGLGLASSHPLTHLGAAAFGVQPFVEREGGFRKIQTTHTGTAGALADRLRVGMTGLTNMGGAFSQDKTANPYGPSVAGRIASRLVPSVVSEGSTAHAATRGVQLDAGAALEGWKERIRNHRGDPEAQAKDISDAEADAEQNGLNPRIRRAALLPYQHAINAGRSTGALRFERQNPNAGNP